MQRAAGSIGVFSGDRPAYTRTYVFHLLMKVKLKCHPLGLVRQLDIVASCSSKSSISRYRHSWLQKAISPLQLQESTSDAWNWKHKR